MSSLQSFVFHVLELYAHKRMSIYTHTHSHAPFNPYCIIHGSRPVSYVASLTENVSTSVNVSVQTASSLWAYRHVNKCFSTHIFVARFRLIWQKKQLFIRLELLYLLPLCRSLIGLAVNLIINQRQNLSIYLRFTYNIIMYRRIIVLAEKLYRKKLTMAIYCSS